MQINEGETQAAHEHVIVSPQGGCGVVNTYFCLLKNSEKYERNETSIYKVKKQRKWKACTATLIACF